MSRSKASVVDRVLLDLGERLSTSITSSLPLLEPPFKADLLNGDICTNNHKIEKTSAKTQNTNINLINVKLVHKHKHKNLRQNTTVSNEQGISAKTCNYH